MASLQARRILGDQFTADDTLEVKFNHDEDMDSVVYTLVKVSGQDVTHGGGGAVGVYLHYKNHNTDADDDGIIDYSVPANMVVEQQAKGTTVIKVKAETITKSDADTFATDYQAWLDDDSLDEPTLTKTYYETGEITLTWNDDTFV